MWKSLFSGHRLSLGQGCCSKEVLRKKNVGCWFESLPQPHPETLLFKMKPKMTDSWLRDTVVPEDMLVEYVGPKPMSLHIADGPSLLGWWARAALGSTQQERSSYCGYHLMTTHPGESKSTSPTSRTEQQSPCLSQHRQPPLEEESRPGPGATRREAMWSSTGSGWQQRAVPAPSLV